MPRSRPPERIDEIADAAIACFTDGGFKRTQMADVAKAAGVAAGSLYLYVDSKEALMHLAVLRVCDQPVRSLVLPLAAPGMATSAAMLKQRVEAMRHWPALDRALQPAAQVGGDTLRAIGRELYDMLHTARRVIWLIDSCARDIAEIEALLVRDLRGHHRDQLALVATRGSGSALPPSPQARLAARIAIETVAWGAMHRFRESPANMIEGLAEAAAREVVAGSFAACLEGAGD